MFIHCKLVIVIFVLSLDGQVHTGEIIDGHQAVPHSRPYMVLLERHMQDGRTRHCGGFLLNEDFVMTAAHCKARSYNVLLGLHDFHKRNESQKISVEQAFPHKDFNETNLKNDVMLLKLSSKAKFSNNVKPIAITDQGDGSLPKSCIVSGWGTTDRKDGHMSSVLMEVNVTLIFKKECNLSNIYCSEGETSPGEGDSGGPLVCEDGKAYGVVSYTVEPKSGDPLIHAYAKIPDYRRWIVLTMKNGKKMEKQM